MGKHGRQVRSTEYGSLKHSRHGGASSIFTELRSTEYLTEDSKRIDGVCDPFQPCPGQALVTCFGQGSEFETLSTPYDTETRSPNAATGTSSNYYVESVRTSGIQEPRIWHLPSTMLSSTT